MSLDPAWIEPSAPPAGPSLEVVDEAARIPPGLASVDGSPTTAQVTDSIQNRREDVRNQGGSASKAVDGQADQRCGNRSNRL